MKVKDLITLLGRLPEEYDDARVYVNMDADGRPQEELLPELYCDIIRFTIDVEDGCILITGDLS